MRSKVDVAALGDEERVAERVREIAEHGRHLLGGLEEELIAVIPEALGVVHGAARADAQQDVVRDVIAVIQVVHVVRADERQAEVLRDRHQPAVHDLLILDAVPLHLEEEVVRSEDVAEGGRRGARTGSLRAAQLRRDLTFEAAAQADQPLRVSGEQFLVDARLAVEALRVARGDELDQVVPALAGFGEQHEMVVGLGRGAALLEPAAGRHVHLAPENRLHTACARVVVEHDRREHVAVLRHGHGRHLQLPDLIQQLIDPARAIEQRELGVQVKVDEFGHGTEKFGSRSVEFGISSEFGAWNADLARNLRSVRRRTRHRISGLHTPSSFGLPRSAFRILQCLLPLDRGWRLGADVVDDAVDALDLVDDA